MSEKVKLPREVVETIDRIKNKYPTWANQDLCYIVLNRLGYCQYENNADIKFIHQWSNTREYLFAKALYLGYEVEETPEERVYHMFNEAVTNEKNDALYTKNTWWEGRRMAIIDTLNALEIKIEGINK